MRSELALGASALAAIASVVADIAGAVGVIPLFAGLTFVGGFAAWAAHDPYVGWRPTAARALAGLWLIAAVWAGSLLLLYLWTGGSRPPPVDTTVLGLPAELYHAVALYGGLPLMLASAYGPQRWFPARLR